MKKENTLTINNLSFDLVIGLILMTVINDMVVFTGNSTYIEDCITLHFFSFLLYHITYIIVDNWHSRLMMIIFIPFYYSCLITVYMKLFTGHDEYYQGKLYYDWVYDMITHLHYANPYRFCVILLWGHVLRTHEFNLKLNKNIVMDPINQGTIPVFNDDDNTCNKTD